MVIYSPGRQKEEKIMIDIRKDKILIPWALVFLWMSLIFHLFAQPFELSNGLSTQVTEIIIDTGGAVMGVWFIQLDYLGNERDV